LDEWFRECQTFAMFEGQRRRLDQDCRAGCEPLFGQRPAEIVWQPNLIEPAWGSLPATWLRIVQKADPLFRH
jgi:hypothetical protein